MQELFQHKKFLVSLLLLLLAGVISLAGIAYFFPVFSLDITISRAFQETRSPALASLMTFISLFGNSWIPYAMVGLAALGFFAFSHRREALFIIFTPAGSGVNFLIKNLVNRPRPDGSMVKLYVVGSGPSFPSGHVAYYVSFFGFLLILMIILKRIPRFIRFLVGAPSLTLILLIPFSRIYLGVHWATDVIGGFLVGLAVLLVLLLFYFQKSESEKMPISTS